MERDRESAVQESKCVVNEGSRGVELVFNGFPTMWWGPLFIGKKRDLFSVEKTTFLSAVWFFAF